MNEVSSSRSLIGRWSLAALALVAMGSGEAGAVPAVPPCEGTRSVFDPLWLGMSTEAARAALGGALETDENSNGTTLRAKRAGLFGLNGMLHLYFNKLGRLNNISLSVYSTAGTEHDRRAIMGAAAVLGMASASPSLAASGEMSCATPSASGTADRKVVWFKLSGAVSFSVTAIERGTDALAPIARPTVDAGASRPAPTPVSPAKVASAPYGPVVGGLRLGMTEAAAQALLGAKMQLHARYRRFAVFTVESFLMLGAQGRLKLQFDEGVGLTEIYQFWSFKEIDAVSRHLPGVLAWAEVDPRQADELTRKLRIAEAEDRRRASLTADQQMAEFKAGLQTFNRPLGEDLPDVPFIDPMPSAKRSDKDVEWTVGVSSIGVLGLTASLTVKSMRQAPLIAAYGEEPLRNRFSEADEAFERSLQRATKAQGVLSGFHGVYAMACRASSAPMFGEISRVQLRMRFLIWSEGDRVFIHTGTMTEPKQRPLLAVRGRDQLVVQDAAGAKQKLEVFMVDVDEQLPSGIKSRWLLADDRMLVVEGEDLKGMTAIKRCERL